MDHLSEVMIIVRAAWEGDKVKAERYLQFLAEKLTVDGEGSQAKHLLDLLEVLQGRKAEVRVYPAVSESYAEFRVQTMGSMVNVDSATEGINFGLIADMYTTGPGIGLQVDDESKREAIERLCTKIAEAVLEYRGKPAPGA